MYRRTLRILLVLCLSTAGCRNPTGPEWELEGGVICIQEKSGSTSTQIAGGGGGVVKCLSARGPGAGDLGHGGAGPVRA